MKHKIKISEGGSKYIGTLPLGCLMCIRGQKLVLFMGGSCARPKRCSWYCPISAERKNSEQIYADEIRIKDPSGAINEANLIRALGCSFTGGDPLSNPNKIEQTLFFLKKLKHKFSDEFHAHLYTSGRNFTQEIAKKLSNAGLNEIRFHPAEKDFHRIQYAMDLGMEVGGEVPVIPTSESKEYILNLIDYLDSIGADFINLNEFEINEPNSSMLKERGFKLRGGSIGSVIGSAELADEILGEFPERYMISVHYCPISLKDGPQLRNRYKRRAESVSKPFEEITEDGTLIFLHVKGGLKELKAFYNELLNESGVPDTMMELQIDTIPLYLDLPWFLSEEKAFKDALDEYNLSAGITEILPFRGEYCEICEHTPIITDK
ncbi:MAG: radical SAM protein [Promethearchaeota archaeon]